MSIIFSALSVTLAGAVAPALAPTLPITLKNEAYFGVYRTLCPVPNTSDRHGLAGSMFSSKPPIDEIELVERFVSDRSATIVASYVDRSRLSVETIVSCKQAIKAISRNKTCASSPAFLLGDGEVRKSWACHGASAYDMYFTFEAGRISNIWSKDGFRSPVPIEVVRERGK